MIRTYKKVQELWNKSKVKNKDEAGIGGLVGYNRIFRDNDLFYFVAWPTAGAQVEIRPDDTMQIIKRPTTEDEQTRKRMELFYLHHCIESFKDLYGASVVDATTKHILKLLNGGRPINTSFVAFDALGNLSKIDYGTTFSMGNVLNRDPVYGVSEATQKQIRKALTITLNEQIPISHMLNGAQTHKDVLERLATEDVPNPITPYVVRSKDNLVKLLNDFGDRITYAELAAIMVHFGHNFANIRKIIQPAAMEYELGKAPKDQLIN